MSTLLDTSKGSEWVLEAPQAPWWLDFWRLSTVLATRGNVGARKHSGTTEVLVYFNPSWRSAWIRIAADSRSDD